MRRTFFRNPGSRVPLLSLVAAAVMIGVAVRGQNIVKTEYFLDSDPGFGMGTEVPVAPAPNVSNLQFSIGLGSVTDGFHTLFVRAVDDSARWSLARVSPFYKSVLSASTLPLVTRAEYFMDSDPGPGAGTPVQINPSSNITNLQFAIGLGSVSPGFHTLFIRACDENGRWTLAQVRGFFNLSPGAGTLPDVTRVEYFLDNDPGFGAGIPVAVSPAPNNSNLQFLIDLAPVTAGFHTLYVRACDSQGHWSLSQVHNFFKAVLPPVMQPEITAVEYFLDADPGFGSGTAVPVTPSTDIDDLAFNVNLGSVPEGFHTLYVRARDGNGRWSLSMVRSFFKTQLPPAQLPSITAAEYFIGTDPGFGMGTAIPVTPASTIDDLGFTVDLSSVPEGFHLLTVRTRDANGRWSLAVTRPFFRAAAPQSLPDVARVEYFFDTDPGRGNGISVPVAPSPVIPNLSFVIDLGTQSPGPHTVWIRACDNAGRWSQPVWHTYTQTNLPVSVSISASAVQVCAGTAVTFTATPVNGGETPVYQWKVNGVNAGNGGATFTYTPADGDIVTCVMTSSLPNVNGNPATSNPVTMSVTSLSATVSGTTTVCAGSGTQAYTTEPGMSSYTWTLSGGGQITSGQGTSSVQVAWQSAGLHTVSVSYSNAAGCSTSVPGSLPVVVSGLPSAAGAIAGPVYVCAGQQGVTYSIAPVPGATSYLWNVPQGVTIVNGAGTPAITINFPSLPLSGLLSVRAVNACGNGAASPWFEVISNPVSTDEDTLVNINVPAANGYCHLARIITAGGPGNTFTVQTGGNARLIAGESIRLLPGVRVFQGGFLQAFITVWCEPCTIQFKDDQDSMAGDDGIRNDPEKIAGTAIPDVSVYPNPSAGDVTVALAGLPGNADLTVELSDALGQPLMRTGFGGSKTCLIPLGKYPAGLYLLKIETPGGVMVKKLVRQ